ncbi:acylphosphatase [Robbsia andropogonis]|uniref:acylphosphatase n=1 Tax=Robbsia andropogonis TaxID=28092 RepID=A0A0F5K3L0_9BURK|nr:acylphosphatase [Robbsia andropogonis]KKB64673.1 acylphosphatase [Robbsia andropogonis]MCP1117854.1 acylphosphatase [Robbsia andropogonis]MCP1127318.1 acylphosphatase [Robbsia andropogonis]
MHSFDMDIETYAIRVSGRVQGVGYRAAAVRRAHLIGVRGWVRNVADGTVEGVIQGSVDQVDRMLEWLRLGPPMARVETVDSERIPDDRRFSHFEQR